MDYFNYLENDRMEEDLLHEECGVFGVFSVDKAAEITYYAIHSLQHRGQEGAGIVTSDKGIMKRVKGLGLVNEVFNDANLSQLKGDMAIGHVRYSTAGGGGIENVQPFMFNHHSGQFALCHNGNLVNSDKIKHMCEERGSLFQSTSDSEILAHLLRRNGSYKGFVNSIKEAFEMLEGSFAFLIMLGDRLFACRDKYGLRPLSLGKLDDGYVVSSETCAFEVMNATFIRDIEPGEILEISKEGLKSYTYSEETNNMMCAMEYIYFARPDSQIEGKNVHSFRKESGKLLFREKPTEADIVIGVPDSSLSAAIGYSEASGIPYEMGLIKNKYVGRTFIQPSKELREKGVKMKLSAVSSIVKDKRVVLIDDSIVRGTTSKYIVTLLKEAGAKEVHVRIASPQIKYPCFYGVDISTYQELISANKSIEEIEEYIGADSLYFISQDALFSAAQRNSLCLACFNGSYVTGGSIINKSMKNELNC
ncbi:MAG: amidophosphoribosyltransferase [Lachnospiraceae bacterium]|nr:amidophosphoribosyltransferase [Lachnospiraceae bacterium]